MTIWAHWRGLIARTGVDTRDGRRLELSDFPAAHFIRLPVAVTARPKPESASDFPAFTIVGRVDRVSIRSDSRPPGPADPGSKEIHAEGVLDLDALFEVRPDLRSTTFSGPITPGDAVEHDLWPVGIEVTGAELREDGDRVVCSGRWELMAMAIEHDTSVWPAVGLQLTRFEDDGRIKA